jgi:hypothetical protein
MGTPPLAREVLVCGGQALRTMFARISTTYLRKYSPWTNEARIPIPEVAIDPLCGARINPPQHTVPHCKKYNLRARSI